MKRTYAIALSLLALAFVACTSDMDDRDRRPPQGYPGGGEGRGAFARARTEGAGDGLKMMPPSDWWRDPRISVAINLTPDQVSSLDRISNDPTAEIAKLDRARMLHDRDLLRGG